MHRGRNRTRLVKLGTNRPLSTGVAKTYKRFQRRLAGRRTSVAAFLKQLLHDAALSRSTITAIARCLPTARCSSLTVR